MGIQTATIGWWPSPMMTGTSDCQEAPMWITPWICTGNDPPLLYGNNGSLDPKQLLLMVVYPVCNWAVYSNPTKKTANTHGGLFILGVYIPITTITSVRSWSTLIAHVFFTISCFPLVDPLIITGQDFIPPIKTPRNQPGSLFPLLMWFFPRLVFSRTSWNKSKAWVHCSWRLQMLIKLPRCWRWAFLFSFPFVLGTCFGCWSKHMGQTSGLVDVLDSFCWA